VLVALDLDEPRQAREAARQAAEVAQHVVILDEDTDALEIPELGHLG